MKDLNEMTPEERSAQIKSIVSDLIGEPPPPRESAHPQAEEIKRIVTDILGT